MKISTRCIAETNTPILGEKSISWKHCKRSAVMTREGWPVCKQHGKAKHFNSHPEVRR